MGLGGPALGLLSIALDNNCFDTVESVVELGNQELSTGHACFVRDFPYSCRPKCWPSLRNNTEEDIEVVKEMKTSEIYNKIGFSKYASIDANGLDGAHVFDLNFSISRQYGFVEQYDLVTNFGTTEHVFDQKACFENIHNLTKPGGLMIGCVPFQGCVSHGLAHYQPVFFEELAQANNYDILGIYYTIAHPEIYTIFPFPFSRELLDTIHNRFSFDISPYLYEEELCYILRKNSDSGFSLPYQTGQLKGNKLNVNLLTDITTKELVYSEPDMSIDDYIKTFAK